MVDINAVRAAAGGNVGADDVMVALGRMSAARIELDQTEAALITSARGAGLSWRRIAAALGLGSPQAAEQRARRLDTALRGGGRAATRPARAHADTGTTSPGEGPDATSAINEPLTRARSALRPATTKPRRRPPVTGPTIDSIAARRKLTAKDFTNDPYYDLARSPDGTWQVTAADTPIGHLQRAGRRWTPTTDGTPLTTRPSPTRADAAYVIVQHHQAGRRRR